jgi:hypothetical protein
MIEISSHLHGSVASLSFWLVQNTDDKGEIMARKIPNKVTYFHPSKTGVIIFLRGNGHRCVLNRTY